MEGSCRIIDSVVPVYQGCIYEGHQKLRGANWTKTPEENWTRV